MTFLFVGIAFDVTQILSLILILLYYLDSIDSNGLISPPMTMLVFFGGLDLRLISKRGILGLGLVFVFIGGLVVGLLIGVLFHFLGQQIMTFRIPGINFSNVKG